MIDPMAKDTRTYADRKAQDQGSEKFRRLPRRPIPAPAELWELVERAATEGRADLSARERGQAVNTFVRQILADAVGRPDLAE